MKINYTICPHCGCPFTYISQEVEEWSLANRYPNIRRHVNGDSWETITFACGRKDEYIPNYGSIRTSVPCKNLEENIIRLIEINKAKTALINMVKEAEVPDSFKKKLLRDIKYYD